VPGYEHTKNSPYPTNTITQEPKITGNSGNTGNGLVGRGFQPLPPNKRSGNRWQHKLDSEYKRLPLLRTLVITVAGKKALATKTRIWQRLEGPF
jgi:hypothetical protein